MGLQYVSPFFRGLSPKADWPSYVFLRALRLAISFFTAGWRIKT